MAGGADPRALALIASANRIGANPRDLATVMSFESGFSPSIRGGSGNRHIGLIQFGGPEQRQYGAHQGQSFEEQLPAVERYLTDRGFKPGMGLMDLYSTVNAGSPGLYNRSDTANGGTPGTVADKVNTQFGRHFAAADKFLAGTDYASGAPSAAPSGPFGFGASAPARTSAYTEIDPLTRQPLDGGGNDVGDLAAMFQATAAPADPGGDMGVPAMPAPPMSDAAPALSLSQAQAQFDPGRFYGLLPRRRFG